VRRIQTILAGMIFVELILFLVSLPGFGIETRSFTQYAAWAGPVFLILTLAIFAGGIASLALLRRNPDRSSTCAMAMAGAAITTVALDTSHVGGPPPPVGPFWLGVVGAVIALAIIWAAIRGRGSSRQTSSTAGSPERTR
jgi:hypothetical protein